MKGVVITSDGKMYVKDFTNPLYQSVGAVVGGWIEIVHAKGLKAPYCFVVNEEGLLKGLPVNLIGCAWYQTWKHGCPIVGNLVVLKDGIVDGEPDIVGLDAEEIREIKTMVIGISGRAIEEVKM